MTSTEVITSNSRSEGAKRMWEKRKAVKQMEEGQTMNMKPPFREWIFHAEWLTSIAVILGCFVFLANRINHTNDRLDAHIQSINSRADELHKEFYALLKEMNKRDGHG